MNRRAFVTGGSGFVGGQVVRKLLQRGYEVRSLVRSPRRARELAALGAHIVPGDVLNRDSMIAAMRGCDIVFHVAGYAEIGEPDAQEMETVNVGGTRKVLRLAMKLSIPRIIFTSTVEVLGDTNGILVDETYSPDSFFLTEHARTKWLAHYHLALPLMRSGAPIVIVMPGAIYGPGGKGLLMDLMRLFYRGYPFVAGSDTALTLAHVEDIAEGHILAAETGRPGESYILSGPAVSLGDLMDFWAYLTGRRAPPVHLPGSVVRAAAPLVHLLGRPTGLQAAFGKEGALVAGATFLARSDKARAELGWQTRPLQDGMLETLKWVAAEEMSQRNVVRQRETQLAAVALGFATLLVAISFLRQRPKRYAATGSGAAHSHPRP